MARLTARFWVDAYLARLRGYDIPAFVEMTSGQEPEVDASISRQRSFDPDLWVIEVEDRQGRHLLHEDGLS